MKILDVFRNISEESDSSLRMIQFIEEHVEKLESSSLCHFYWEKKNLIENAVSDANEKIDSYKNEIPEIKWVIDNSIFEKLRDSI